MNKMYKRVISLMALALMFFAFNIVAFAQGTTTITLSKNSASVGDSITVTVEGTESGTITVKYTASMLTLTDCSVSGYSSEGNSVSFSGKTGDITFSAAAEGTASIIVSSSANSGSSTTLTIGGSASSTSTETTDTSQASETADTVEETTETAESTETTEVTTTSSEAVGTLNSDGGFDIGGVSYVVSERYSDSEVPSGFSKTTITIGSSTYSEPTNGSITLLYLKPADNTSGSGVFYLYDEAAGTVSQFLMLGDSDNYVIISAASGAPSSDFTEASIEVTGGSTTAYTVDGSQFFYVYGTNGAGTSGWFVYDSINGTVSKMDESLLTLTSSTSETTTDSTETTGTTDTTLYVSKLNLYRKVIMGLIVLCVILLFVIINRAIKGRGDDDDFDGDVFAASPKKSSKRLPRSIVFNHDEEYNEEQDDEYDDEYLDDEEYDDYDEEIDEYDDEEDYSTSRYESESYEARRASSLNMMDLNDL